jgi:hypothetical protein
VRLSCSVYYKLTNTLRFRSDGINGSAKIFLNYEALAGLHVDEGDTGVIARGPCPLSGGVLAQGKCPREPALRAELGVEAGGLDLFRVTTTRTAGGGAAPV